MSDDAKKRGISAKYRIFFHVVINFFFIMVTGVYVDEIGININELSTKCEEFYSESVIIKKKTAAKAVINTTITEPVNVSLEVGHVTLLPSLLTS